MNTLVDTDFIRELEVIRRRLRVDARSGHAGERAGTLRGGNADFAEHRSYAPGDDLRRLDWRALARTGHPIVKVFHFEEDVVFRLLVDASRSMTEPIEKMNVARRIAAAIGYLALANSERAQLLASSSGDGAAPRPRYTPHRGRHGLTALLREIEQLEPGGSEPIGAAAHRALSQSRLRRGVLVLISDFLAPGPIEAAIRRARAAGHEVHLVQVLSPDELEPSLEGDRTLVDVETGEEVFVTIDATSLDAYAKRLDELIQSLRKLARTTGARYQLAPTDSALEATIREFVRQTGTPAASAGVKRQ